MPNASENPITFDGNEVLIDKIFTDQFSAIMEVNYTNLYDYGIKLNKDDIILEYEKSDVDNITIIELENEEL